jgi:A/G-specific adenine glycosylase
MDLGATVCVARQPACERCPLREVCAAWAEVSAATLFPSGEALARMRNERASAGPASVAQVAEAAGQYRAPTRRARKSAQPFTSTTRYFRGRIIHALRALAPGESLGLGELGPLVKPEFCAEDMPWLRDMARGLARDGLARLEPDAAASDHDLRVSLP